MQDTQTKNKTPLDTAKGLFDGIRPVRVIYAALGWIAIAASTFMMCQWLGGDIFAAVGAVCIQLLEIAFLLELRSGR